MGNAVEGSVDGSAAVVANDVADPGDSVPEVLDLEDEQLDLALRELPPLANQIVDTAIDNMSRKLIAGYRNKKNALPNAKKTDLPAETVEALKAASAESVVEVANRGQAWKEMIQKTLTRGVGSLSTMEFDGQFKISGGKPDDDFKKMPNSPGVYVVFDAASDRPVYVGDSDNMQRRWHSGHLNEHRQGQREGGTPYKLAGEFENGCTVKFIKMESRETAAALEAHLIRENFKNFEDISKKNTADAEKAAARDEALADGMLKNQRNELATEQGTRSNQEAKKMKDSSGSATTLAVGAGKEAAINITADLFHTIATTIVKAVKNELVDVIGGGRAPLKVRVERVIRRLASAVKNINLWAILRGLVEFIVNALSKAIGQIMNLARNLWDLGNGAWQLYRGAKTMSREELVRKISATVVTSGALVVWDALDPMIEAKLTGVIGPFAPYVSATLVAIGFGLSSYALNEAVTKVIDSIVAFKQGYIDSLEASREACQRIMDVAELELQVLASLADYKDSALDLHETLADGTRRLSQHQALEPVDFEKLMQEVV